MSGWHNNACHDWILAEGRGEVGEKAGEEEKETSGLKREKRKKMPMVILHQGLPHLTMVNSYTRCFSTELRRMYLEYQPTSCKQTLPGSFIGTSKRTQWGKIKMYYLEYKTSCEATYVGETECSPMA